MGKLVVYERERGHDVVKLLPYTTFSPSKRVVPWLRNSFLSHVRKLFSSVLQETFHFGDEGLYKRRNSVSVCDEAAQDGQTEAKK